MEVLSATQLADRASKAFLVLLRGDKSRPPELGRRYEIPPTGIILGDIPEAEIFIQSKHYRCGLRLFLKKNDWCLHDETGFSQALINGVPSQMAFLADGDILRIEPYMFEFYLGNGAKAAFYDQIYECLQEDILTRAYNRRYLFDLLNWEIRRYGQKEDSRRAQKSRALPPAMALLMLDIDHFGTFNRNFDHLVGDEVLKCVVQRIKDRVRSTDIVARYGGEEFCVYLPDTTHHQAMELAEQIRLKIAEGPFVFPYKNKNESVIVTVSVGVASYEPEMDVNAFIRAADERMLQAKAQGRNCVLG